MKYVSIINCNIMIWNLASRIKFWHYNNNNINVCLLWCSLNTRVSHIPAYNLHTSYHLRTLGSFTRLHIIVMMQNMVLSTIRSCDLTTFTQPPHTDHEKARRLIPCVEVSLAANQNGDRHSGDMVTICFWGQVRFWVTFHLAVLFSRKKSILFEHLLAMLINMM